MVGNNVVKLALIWNDKRSLSYQIRVRQGPFKSLPRKLIFENVQIRIF